MNKPTHTPGPWRVVPIGSARYVESDSGFICDMERDHCSDDFETARCDANACLIAAAPDLLEALERIMEQLTETGTVNAYEGQRAEIAIAKAKGKI